MPSQEHERVVQSFISNPLEGDGVEALRANFANMLARESLPDDANIEHLSIKHMDVDWVSVPGAREDSVILYLHGGGYAIGSNVAYREFASRIARACRSRILLVNYRLAPEHRYPAAVDDAVMAYQWLLEQGTKACDITIAGDSAGGGLVMATLLSLREAGVSMPRNAFCLSPWADLELRGESAKPGVVDDPVLSADGLALLSQIYAGDKVQNQTASPVNADLAGLPPLLIFVGSREVLYDDAVRLAEHAERDGVDVTLCVGDGLIHVWSLFPMPETDDVMAKIAEFVG